MTELVLAICRLVVRSFACSLFFVVAGYFKVFLRDLVLAIEDELLCCKVIEDTLSFDGN